MDSLPVSVIVVSRARPQALARCLMGLAQLDYPSFEIVLVACPEGIKAAQGRPDVAQIKLVPFDAPNISAARNAGIAAAAGEITAFIDDDAVPEPLWLQHLIAPFSNSEVAASGGYVLGRNGISFQWRARTVDPTGTATDLDLPSTNPVVLTPEPGRAIKTEGTNMALRRTVLAEMGGFDPAFEFYLDETDLNMRLAQRGLPTAIVPLAQVHHGFAPSARRSADRTPTDLTQIGASQMVFLRKHCPASPKAKTPHKAEWRAFRQGQRARLLRLMQRGPLAPGDVLRLLRSLDRGAKLGAAREITALPAIPHPNQGFLPFPGRPAAPRQVIAGRVWQAARLRAKAREDARQGAVVSLFLFSPTARYHRVQFTDAGVWEQVGGRFGRSLRNAPLMRYWRFSARLRSEQARIVAVRGETTPSSL